MAEIPEVQYTKTVDGVHIAFQVVGDGPIDLVLVGWLTNVEHIWRWPSAASFFRKLAAHARLIMLDRRGTGLSDHTVDKARAMELDARMDDIRAVMDAAGSERAVLLGIEDGFALTALFAATYPQRTSALIACGASARTAWAPDYQHGTTPEDFADDIASVERSWGTNRLAREWMPYVFPDDIDNEETIEHFSSWMRSGGGPGDVVSWYEVDWQLDVREILPAIRVPTLVLHRVGDRAVPIENGRYIAEHVPGAKLVELPGTAHGWTQDDDVPDAVGNFLAELRREEAEFDRVLASVMFTDIVGSTDRASKLGDRGWRELVERHHSVTRGLLGRYRGTEVDTAGDGFFATFDGPARAVRCAQSIVEAVRPLDIEVRAGVHTGEVETINDKVGGIAVAIGARVASKAAPSEVLVSQTVKDLTAGSGLVFEDAGEHELKGVPDRWRLYKVVSS
ncbi:MAG: adenylate/guanylate cyclase domain-containing protein [Actinomycetota bacterium]